MPKPPVAERERAAAAADDDAADRFPKSMGVDAEADGEADGDDNDGDFFADSSRKRDVKLSLSDARLSMLLLCRATFSLFSSGSSDGDAGDDGISGSTIGKFSVIRLACLPLTLTVEAARMLDGREDNGGCTAVVMAFVEPFTRRVVGQAGTSSSSRR